MGGQQQYVASEQGSRHGAGRLPLSNNLRTSDLSNCQGRLQVRGTLAEFTAGMLGGLARNDQRAAGELYVRGLLTGGRRKSMQPMAARLGVAITSSTG